MRHLPTAEDIMQPRNCRTLHAEDDIIAALQLFMDHDMSTAPVLDAEDRLVGILTEKDCLRLISAEMHLDAPAAHGLVKTYMSPIGKAIEPYMDLFAIVSTFLNCEFACLPVLREGRIVGCVSRRQLLNAILQIEKQQAADKASNKEFQSILRSPGARHHIESTVSTMSKEQLAEIFLHRKH